MNTEFNAVAIIIVTILAISLGITFFGAYNEARVFNKFHKEVQATTFDALFAELRIEACN